PCRPSGTTARGSGGSCGWRQRAADRGERRRAARNAAGAYGGANCADGAAGADGGEGTGRGGAPAVAGASAPRTSTSRPNRASPRTYTPGAAPHHPPTLGATHTPTAPAAAPQASGRAPRPTDSCAAGIRTRTPTGGVSAGPP